MPASHFLEQTNFIEALIVLLYMSALSIPLMVAVVSFGWKSSDDDGGKPKGGGPTDSDEQRAHPLF